MIILQLLLALLLSVNVSNFSIPAHFNNEVAQPVPIEKREEKREEGLSEKTIPRIEYYEFHISDLTRRSGNLRVEIDKEKEKDSPYITEWESYLQELIQERDRLIAERDQYYPPAP